MGERLDLVIREGKVIEGKGGKDRKEEVDI